MDTDLLKYLIPVMTFILGSALTLSLKAWEQRRSTMQHSITILRRLTNEWYNQLYELFGDGKDNADPAIVDAFTRYLNNRIILPELLMHFEILGGNKMCKPFLSEIEKFLLTVANCNDRKGIVSKNDRYSWTCANLLDQGRTLTPNQVLKVLDPVVQRISIQAGALLK